MSSQVCRDAIASHSHYLTKYTLFAYLNRSKLVEIWCKNRISWKAHSYSPTAIVVRYGIIYFNGPSYNAPNCTFVKDTNLLNTDGEIA